MAEMPFFFPAHAGVIPGKEAEQLPHHPFPRLRGDDPTFTRWKS